MSEDADLSLIVRRVIAASPARLFEAWTSSEQLPAWWGPKGTRCTHAEIDARVGGRYRIANELADGRVIWIVGEFLVVEPPERLVFSWRTEPGESEPERVTVRFDPRGSETEVVVIHERVRSLRSKDEHAVGWEGCLEGLAAHATSDVQDRTV